MDQFMHVAKLVKVGIPAQSAVAMVWATTEAFALKRENPATALERFNAIGHMLAIAQEGTVTDAQAVAIIEVLRDALL